MGRLNYHWGQFNFWNKFFNSVSLFYVIVIIIIFFWPSVDMFPREFKNWDIQNWVQIYQSVQSGVDKLSCNKTALKRCTSTETQIIIIICIIILTPVLNSRGMNKLRHAIQKNYKNQAGMNLTPPPPNSQNSHA